MLLQLNIALLFPLLSLPKSTIAGGLIMNTSRYMAIFVLGKLPYPSYIGVNLLIFMKRLPISWAIYSCKAVKDIKSINFSRNAWELPLRVCLSNSVVKADPYDL